MARAIRDALLESRTSRSRLATGDHYHKARLDHGLSLYYRRGERGGSWSAHFYVGGKKYRVVKIGTADDRQDADGVGVFNFSQAQREARKLREAASRSAAGLPDKAHGPATVATAMVDYLAHLANDGRNPTNVADAARKIEAHIVPKLGGVRLDQLTARQVQAWHHALAKQPPRLRVRKGAKQRHRVVDMTDPETRRSRQATANRVFGIFKAALNMAWRNDPVLDDKAWRKVQPFRGATASRARYLTFDECARLSNACDSDFRALVQGALHTGCRYSELTRLAPRDFDERAGTLAIRLSKSQQPRHIMLSADAVEFFADRVARAGSSPWLFTRGGLQWKRSWQIRPMVEASRAAHVKPAASFHILRHTFASHAIMAGAALMVVAETLGHADTRMVELHYGHLAPNFVTDEIRRTAPRYGFAVDRSTVTPLRPR
jgi:integrase